jgi:hypothetical protein
MNPKIKGGNVDPWYHLQCHVPKEKKTKPVAERVKDKD